MNFVSLFARLCWVFFWLSGCSLVTDKTPIIFVDTISNDAEAAPVFYQFRSGIQVELTDGTELDDVLLAERESYATTFTDPYGYAWTMSTALGLSDQDFAKAGVWQASTTASGATFYYAKILTWEIQADCVVYVAASDINTNFVSLRRNQDQGACPTSAGYAEWLPRASTTENKNEPARTLGSLYAYGANNHQYNLLHGSFRGVEAYGNDPYGWYCGDFQLLSDCLAYSGVQLTGRKWDSAEFVSRYFMVEHKRDLLWQGPAKYWYQMAQNYGLKKHSNCGSVRPEVGDMLVSTGGEGGHAAIIRAVSDHNLTVIQQNWFESEHDNASALTMSTSGRHYCVSDFGHGYAVAGWIRP